ncbi:MAG TPA: diguanylate cyclase [Steroidobacteraceae bacterium]|nr:diguanylate cyclase [Steroidobacteraceae bacterium]
MAVLAATAPVSAQEFSFSSYTQEMGLRNLGIEQMLVDRSGDLWLATDGGLYRYDGTSFTPYNKARGIPADATMAMAASPSGRIFVRVDAGVFVGDADHFEPVLTAEGPVIADQFTSLIAPTDDRLLYLKNGQIMQVERRGPGSAWTTHPLFSAERIAAHPELASVEGVIDAGAGRLWFGCGLKLCGLAGQTLTVYGSDQGVPESQYRSVLQDRSGAIWARSLERVVRLRAGAGHFEVLDPPHAVLASRVHRLTLTLDPMGRIVTRTSVGLARWDGSRWEEFGPRNGLPDHPVTAALADADGNFWLAVGGIGLYRWRGYDNLESWTQDQGLDSESVWNIVRDRQHRLILGTDLGCRMLDEKSRLIAPCPYQGFPQQETNASAVDPSGAFWLSYQTSQLWRVPPGGTRAERVTTVPDQFNAAAMLFDRSGTGWIAAGDYGVAKIDSATMAVTHLAPPGNPRVDDVARSPDGTIWVAATNGLYRLQDDHFVKIPTPVDGQQIGIQTVAATVDGSVWGTRIGEKILHLAPGPHAKADWQNPPALNGSTVYSLRADSRGWIWANTGEGLGVYDGHVWRRIEIPDGLIWADTEQFALYSDDDGSIWVGTGRGITHIKDPVRWIEMASRPLQLGIARAQLGTQSLLEGSRPTVRWHDNTALDVSFSSHSFARSAATELRYRLLGLSTEWYSSRTYDIHIPALAPGHYQLEAMSVDMPHWRYSPAVTLEFDVNPPWWNTTVFRIFAVLLVAALLVAAWRWQNQRIHRRQLAMEQEHREREALLVRATRDALTGLWNRATILEFLTGEMDQARKHGGALAVAVIDVDFFKRINDTLGHAGGDEVLKELARRLRAALRQRDSLGRYGGEELLVVMPGLTREDRGGLMDALRANIAAMPFQVGEAGLRVTVSIGVAWMESVHEAPDSLIRRADAALYQAKAAGRNRVVCSIGAQDGSMLEVTGSRRYLQDFIDRVKREAGKRGVETETK